MYAKKAADRIKMPIPKTLEYFPIGLIPRKSPMAMLTNKMAIGISSIVDAIAAINSEYELSEVPLFRSPGAASHEAFFRQTESENPFIKGW